MEAAYRFSVNGTVMNSASNKVFIEAEGSQENLEQFIAWCWKGPLGAKVDKVEIEESSLKNFTRFEIISKV
jgi:acylphosphatase